MHDHNPKNIFDDAPATRRWLQCMPTKVGALVLGSYTQRLDALAHVTAEPYAARVATTRMRELGIHTQLLVEVGTAQARNDCMDIEQSIGSNRTLTVAEAAAYTTAQDKGDAFEQRLAPVKDAMAQFHSEIEYLTGYVEFLKLDAQHKISKSRPEVIATYTNNPRILHQPRLDEYIGQRNSMAQDESLAAAAHASLEDVREQLSLFAEGMGANDPADEGQAFIKSTLLPRMFDDIQYMDAAIADLGAEIVKFANPTINSSVAFEEVASVQAAAVAREQVAQVVASAQASGATNVSSIFDRVSQTKR